MDQLEAAGIVGPINGSNPRDVYISDFAELDKLIKSLDA
jgi:S-DNA-T family DNA segregation ATPase FtsK/SpoIIIE